MSQSPLRSLAPVLILSVLIPALLVGCTGGEEESSLHRVTVAGSGWFGHAPVWIGDLEGIFEKAGFEINFKNVGKSAERMTLLASGHVQFASVGEIAMLTHGANGNDRFYWVGSQDIAPGFEALVINTNVIKDDWEGLKGQTIALTEISSIDLTVRILLRDHGLDPEKDVQIKNVDSAAIAQTFSNGTVAAAAIWQPFLAELLAVPGAKAIGWDTDTHLYKEFKTMTGPDVLVMARAWVDEDPARARRFLAAYFESLEVLAADPQGAAEKVAASGYSEESAETLAAAFDQFVWQGAKMQHEILAEGRLFSQADAVCKMLQEDLGQIEAAPPFREWVRKDVLPD